MLNVPETAVTSNIEINTRSLAIDAEALKRQGRSDASGRFHIKGLPAGTYGLMANFAEVKSADGKGSVNIIIKQPTDVFDLGKILVEKK